MENLKKLYAKLEIILFKFRARMVPVSTNKYKKTLGTGLLSIEWLLTYFMIHNKNAGN